jgi:hypothetical protein
MAVADIRSQGGSLHEAGGSCVLHGNGEGKTLFRQIAAHLRRASAKLTVNPQESAEEATDVAANERGMTRGIEWPWDEGWTPGGSRWHERERALLSLSTAGSENITTSSIQSATHNSKIPYVVATLKYDAPSMKHYGRICAPLWSATSLITDDAPIRHKSFPSTGGFVEAEVVVNGARQQLRVHHGEFLFKTVSAFVAKHDLQAGEGCTAVGDADKRTIWAEAGTGETYNQAAELRRRCVVEHLMLRLERKFFVQELRTMRGDYFDFIAFYGFTHANAVADAAIVPVRYNRFLDNVLTGGVLRDEPPLRRNATRAIRCALLYHNSDNAAATATATTASGNPPFAAAVYALANVLYFIGHNSVTPNGDHGGSDRSKEEKAEALFALLDAATLLNASMAYSWSTLSSARATFLRDELPLRHVVGGEQHHSPNRRCAKTLEQEVEGGSTHGVHIITVATSPRPELVLLERSIRKAFGAKGNNITKSTTCSDRGDGNVPWRFTVLGLGRRWDGLGCKLDWFIEYLRCLLHRISYASTPCPPEGDGRGGYSHGEERRSSSGDHLVVFVDAYDVLATGGCRSASHLKARFQSFGADVVFGAEKNSAPDAAVSLVQYPLDDHHLISQREYTEDNSNDHDASAEVTALPRNRQHLPFLNAGCYMGKAWAVAAMLREVILDLETSHLNGSAYSQEGRRALADVDDQRWFTRYFLRHRKKSDVDVTAALDTKGVLFHSLHGLPRGVLVVDDSHPGVVRSRHTGLQKVAVPCFLHGNAGGRNELKRTAATFQQSGWLG